MAFLKAKRGRSLSSTLDAGGIPLSLHFQGSQKTLDVRNTPKPTQRFTSSLYYSLPFALEFPFSMRE